MPKLNNAKKLLDEAIKKKAELKEQLLGVKDNASLRSTAFLSPISNRINVLFVNNTAFQEVCTDWFESGLISDGKVITEEGPIIKAVRDNVAKCIECGFIQSKEAGEAYLGIYKDLILFTLNNLQKTPEKLDKPNEILEDMQTRVMNFGLASRVNFAIQQHISTDKNAFKIQDNNKGSFTVLQLYLEKIKSSHSSGVDAKTEKENLINAVKNIYQSTYQGIVNDAMIKPMGVRRAENNAFLKELATILQENNVSPEEINQLKNSAKASTQEKSKSSAFIVGSSSRQPAESVLTSNQEPVKKAEPAPPASVGLRR